MSGTGYHIDQTDDGGYLEDLSHRAHFAPAVLENLSLAPEDEYYGSTRATEVEGLIALVKH